MALDKRARDAMLAHCGEIHEDDGIDPREYFRVGRDSSKLDRKAKQLCRQVAETVDQILAGETGDDLLRELRVAQVIPAPDASRLQITVEASPGAKLDHREVDQRLGQVTGFVRSAVAAAITRRKAPALTFVLAGPTSLTAGGNDE
ncbi:hypothetical protein [Aeoliella sp.]|uniref:hypothetical protein n=1 Tax=Aeoliella sp. TaxID=2795800 RepID=UPI003CCBEA94